MKQFLFHFSIIYTILLSLYSCDNSNHINIIPRNCSAIIEADAKTFNLPFKGIDSTKKVYYFEIADGTLGLCAAIDDEYQLDEYLHQLQKTNKTDNFTESEGIQFCTYSNTWILGYDDKRLLLLGPIIPAEYTRTTKRIIKLLHQDEEKSIVKAELWTHLHECIKNDNKEVCMAILASALPEQLTAAFTIGAPRGTAAEDIIIESSINIADSCMILKGHTCSYNMNIRQELHKAQKLYHKLTFDWQNIISDSSLVSIVMNINGNDYMPYIQRNKSLNSLLLGTNAYEEMKSANGNVVIEINPGNHDNYTAKIQKFPNGNYTREERLVVSLDVQNLFNKKTGNIIPLPDNVRRIVYYLDE